jgi:hypothetical protein
LKRSWPSWEEKRNGTGLREYGFVVSGTFPKNASRAIQALWVEFLAKSYFSEGKSDRVLFLNGVDYLPEKNLSIDIKWLQENSLHMKRFQLYSPSVLFVSGKSFELPESFGSNYLAWEVVLTMTTNVGSIVFPAKFEFNQYFPHTKPNHKEYDLRRIYRADFQISRIQNGVSNSGLLPEVLTSARIGDTRFDELLMAKNNQPSMSVVYSVKGTAWKSRESAKALGKVAEILQTRKAVLPTQRQNRFVYILGLTIFAPLLGLGAIWYRYRQKKEN